MIEYKQGNMFESNADCLVNTVNCEGFMGKGIAYQFKLRFPENNKSYIKACKSGELKVGKVHHYMEDGIMVVNFPTKDKWRENSKIEYVENGMDSLLELLPQLDVKKIAIPPLGCGNGGLIWSDVKEIIEKKISCISEKYDFIIFEPSLSTYTMIPKRPPKMSLSSLVLLDIRLHLEQFNRIRLQMAGYFINIFLGKEYFKFSKWRYEPYSHSIDRVAKHIKEYQEYYNIKNSEETFKRIYQMVCSDTVNEKFSKLHIAVKKSTEYLNMIKTDKKLKGISTVLYLVKDERIQSKEEIIKYFKNWSEDQLKEFSEQEILEYITYLENTEMITLDMLGNIGFNQQ